MTEARASFAVLALLGLAALAAPAFAHVLCAFYVADTNTSLHDEATAVVLMREGRCTVFSMQNDYRGPVGPAPFVPVPLLRSAASTG